MLKLILSVCALLMSLSSWARASPRHTRVIWHENPAQEAIVSWTSDEGGRSSYLYYDTEPRGGQLKAYRFRQKPAHQGQYKRNFWSSKTPHYHHVRLNSLLPDTVYHFVVVTDGEASREYWFRTAPSQEGSVELLFGGDSRSDENNRIRMNLVMKQMLESNPAILALVHGGDYVFDGGQWREWESWLSQHDLTTTDDGRLLPIVPTRGNHEGDETLFNEIWAWPGGGKAYYTSQLGVLSVVTLNTEISAFGDQRAWLDKELEKLRRTRPWIVVNYHQPAYPAVKVPSTAKLAWVPLFEKHQIDLAFESDGHVYKQTVPIYKDRYDEERGIIYVGEGGLGVRQRTPDTSRWYLKGSGFAVAAHHVQLLTATPTQLLYKGVSENNETLSQLQLSPRSLRATSPGSAAASASASSAVKLPNGPLPERKSAD